MSETLNTITCPNCGHTHPESFQFCPSCGQDSAESVIGFKEMFVDLLGAFFAFDSKALRSIPKMLFLPGSLTNEYISGKRASYLAPFRLYLFVSIVLFLTLPLVVTDKALFDGALDAPETLDSLIHVAADQVNESNDSIVTTPGALKDSIFDALTPGNKSKVNWSFSNKNDGSVIQLTSGDTTSSNPWTQTVTMVEDGMSVNEAVDSMFQDTRKWVKLMIKQGVKLQTRKAEGIVGAFLDKTSYTLFIFLPIFALFLKLLYVRRKRFYIEHLIFSLHFFSFFFFLLILYILIYRFIGHIPFWPVLTISLVYLYIAMLKVYKQRWGRTLFKWITLVFTTMVLFMPVFFVIAVLISVMFY
ncbi:MAG: DUF3667 domain-containing protein [Bacteroidetes bacterium]|nr:DUF3667 domain-containing protein [Bacteroidota bacterium]